jgi:DNA-directed RNA polymerase specialized sigma24 family protein
MQTAPADAEPITDADLIRVAEGAAHVFRWTREIPAGLEPDDLRQVAIAGALEAKPKYDPTKGASIKTWLYGGAELALETKTRSAWRWNRRNPVSESNDWYAACPDRPDLTHRIVVGVRRAVAELPSRERIVIEGDLDDTPALQVRNAVGVETSNGVYELRKKAHEILGRRHDLQELWEETAGSRRRVTYLRRNHVDHD